MTRRLGIPYLWIDSLCIVQSGDDGKDWGVEAVKMSQYYQFSVLAIAAANVSNAGFLRPKTTGLKDRVVRLPYRDTKGVQSGSFYVHQRQGLYGVSSEYMKDVLEGDLLHRGWVLQEWLLSRRILHRVFAEEETSPKNMWHRIVQSYSGSRLTKPQSDRLVAVAGVAKELRKIYRNQEISKPKKVKFQRSGDTVYVAGCWLQDLHISLLWEQRDRGPLVPSRCGAPTWSWAAWQNPVHWRNLGEDVEGAYQIVGLLSRHEYFSDEPVAPREPVEDHFDVYDGFACLALRGKARLVLVGEPLDEEICEKLAGYTGVRAELMSRWRSLANPIEPLEHIGWADLGHSPTSPAAATENTRQVVQALHVSTNESAAGGFEFGYVGFSHEVYGVLFLTPLDGSGQGRPNRYVRSGVGRIFKKDFFINAEEFDVELA